MSEDKYPHWKNALFGDHDGMVANLRCAVKYVFWHGAYLLLAVFGLILYGMSKLLGAVGRSGAARRTSGALHSPRAKKAGRIGWLITVVLMALYLTVLLVHLLLTQPFILLGGIGLIGGRYAIAGIVHFLTDSTRWDGPQTIEPTVMENPTMCWLRQWSKPSTRSLSHISTVQLTSLSISCSLTTGDRKS